MLIVRTFLLNLKKIPSILGEGTILVSQSVLYKRSNLKKLIKPDQNLAFSLAGLTALPFLLCQLRLVFHLDILEVFLHGIFGDEKLVADRLPRNSQPS